MCITLYLRYLNDDAIQYNLAAYASLINFHRFCCILYTCYDVIVIVSKVKRPKLTPYKIPMCSEPNETIMH